MKPNPPALAPDCAPCPGCPPSFDPGGCEALKASESRYRNLFETMAEGFVLQELIRDARGEPVDSRFLEVNSAFERLTGFPRGRVLGHLASECVPPGPLWGPGFDAETTPGASRHLEAFWPQAGLHFDIFAHSPAPGQFALLFMDITARKEAEERNRAQDLEMRATLEELEAFSYSVSHDLRAPLRHINGFTELLRRELEGTIPGKGAHYLDTILASSTRMAHLIDMLLAFSRSSRAPIQVRTFDPAPVVKDIIANLQMEARDRRVVWDVAPLPFVSADPNLLRTILENLLSNALKFTRNCPEARIRIGSEDLEHETAFFVADNGAGFSPRHAHRLFGVFQRLHPATQYEGSGIGLANVRRIVQRHGGRTWATGERGKGATFTFTLPKAGGGPSP